MSVSCIIPFYNEGERIVNLLNIVTKTKGLSEIICVDDGSIDDAYLEVEKFKNITLIRYFKNQGKAKAVEVGLRKALGDYILLLDADIRNLDSKQLDILLEAIKEDPSLDLLILRRRELPITEIIGGLIYSAERILKKKDLEEIIALKPKGYEFDPAINKYMIKERKKIGWIQGKTSNVRKMYKIGLIKGSLKDFKMAITVIKYLGIREYFNQLYHFRKQQIH